MSLERAVEAVRSARALLITAGAGMGVDSGLPDFRGDEGFWRAYPPYRHLGLSFVDLANPRWFRKDPTLAWGFYGHRLNLYRATRPHQGFAHLAAWAAARPSGAFVFTSNVDGQFQRAGFGAERVVECHGSIQTWQCLDGCGVGLFPAAEGEVRVDPTTFRAAEPLPACRGCGGMARPNILMFGDGGWDDAATRAQEARFERWLGDVGRARAPLAVVECGAGTAVPTVRAAGEALARRLGAALVRINVREPAVPPGGVSLAMGARAALAAMDEALSSAR